MQINILNSILEIPVCKKSVICNKTEGGGRLNLVQIIRNILTHSYYSYVWLGILA